MIRRSVERLSFVALRLTKTLFIYLLKFHNHGVRCCETSSREQIIQNKEQALKELEKRTPHRDVAFLFGVPKNTLSTRKKKKYKIFEKHSSLMSKRVKPELYINGSLIYEVIMSQSVDQCSTKRVSNSPED